MSQREDHLVELTLYLLAKRPLFELLVTNTTARRLDEKHCEVLLQVGARQELPDGYNASVSLPDSMGDVATKLYLTAFLAETEREIAKECKRG